MEQVHVRLKSQLAHPECSGAPGDVVAVSPRFGKQLVDAGAGVVVAAPPAAAARGPAGGELGGIERRLGALEALIAGEGGKPRSSNAVPVAGLEKRVAALEEALDALDVSVPLKKATESVVAAVETLEPRVVALEDAIKAQGQLESRLAAVEHAVAAAETPEKKSGKGGGKKS